MGVLRTILIIVFVYYVIRFFNRYILPLVVKGYINKNKEQFQNSSQDRSRRREGDVTINYNRKDNNKSFDGKGEYVDFEEIDD